MQAFWTANYPKEFPRQLKIRCTVQHVLDVFEKHASVPLKPAFSNMGRSLTYSELNRKAGAFAHFAKRLEMKKGDRIALQMPNLLQFPIAMYGASKLD